MAMSSRGLLGAASPYLDDYAAMNQQRQIEAMMRAQQATMSQLAGQFYPQQYAQEQQSGDNPVLLLLP